jgi:hypothetical protein
LLEEFAIGVDGGCASLPDIFQRVKNYRILRRGEQLFDEIVDIIAETGLNLVMQRRFGHDVEICRYSPIRCTVADLLTIGAHEPAQHAMRRSPPDRSG